jgi:hypothetical protein
VCRQEKKSVRARAILSFDISIQLISHGDWNNKDWSIDGAIADAGQSLKYVFALDFIALVII